MPVAKQNPKWHRTVLLATDNNRSVIGEIADGKTHLIGYSAYGEQSSKQAVTTQLGFTGQMRESNIGWYLLGNGYRAYNPRLMRFHSPDSWSPFGRGGLNVYMFCVGDPVNRSDPSGRWGVLSLLSNAREMGIIGYMTSSVGTGLNVGSLWINRGRTTLANGLGTLSGLTGMAAGLSNMFEIAPQASQLLSATSLVSGVASTYLGYRSMRATFRHVGWYEAPFRRPSGSPPAYFDFYSPPKVSRAAPASPPVYPLNRTTLLPAATGERPPAYSAQDPDMFSTPMPQIDQPLALSPFSEPLQASGNSPLRYQARLRQSSLDQMDGLTPSTAIRQRR